MLKKWARVENVQYKASMQLDERKYTAIIEPEKHLHNWHSSAGVDRLHG